MLYADFINKAYEATITESDNGSFYLEPTWTVILLENNLDPKTISDYETDWAALNNVLKLEVERRNTVNSKKNYVLDWVYNIITTSIEPTMLEEETDYIKNLTEYLKIAHQEQKPLDSEQRENEDWNKFKNS